MFMLDVPLSKYFGSINYQYLIIDIMRAYSAANIVEENLPDQIIRNPHVNLEEHKKSEHKIDLT